jgi:endonuclease YncB( thermonuclease family)
MRGILCRYVVVAAIVGMLAHASASMGSTGSAVQEVTQAELKIDLGPCAPMFGIDSCTVTVVKAHAVEILSGGLLRVTTLDGTARRVELAGIIVPSDEPYASLSRSHLERLVRDEEIELVLICVAAPETEPLVARVLGHGGEVNLELLARGLVRFDRNERGLDSYSACVYLRTEQEARNGKKGLWQSLVTTPDGPN